MLSKSPSLIGPTSDRVRPITSSGIAMTSPAIGPAAPTSNKALRSEMGVFIRITAPNVPSVMIGGTGMKYGSETSTPWWRPTT